MKTKTLFCLLISCFFTATTTFALSLDEAKAKGVVGEQGNGYLGIRENNAETEALATDINARRRTEYLKIAEKNGTTVASVEALAGQKAIDATPKGQYISQNGSWSKK